jgi:hypothetical protein
VAMFIRKEVEHQDRLEAAGYRSPTWRVLRGLQSLLSATQLQGESAVAAPPFFPNAGRGTVRFWGNEQGPTDYLWDGLDEEGREECERTIQTRKDWVVWSRARSVLTNSVRNAFRRQAGWAKLQEVRATAAKHWPERVWFCHNQRWMLSSKEGTAS